ncbi:MAG: HAD-IB family phosphatase [Acidobacteria bacterium]|nr:HAD-IB family phosphatase [Acidobacteriota bacterium]
MGKTLITDFDGTMTERDFFSVLAERYIPSGAPDFFEQWRAGRMSHFEAMGAYFAYAPDDERKMDEVLAECGLDAGAKRAYERLAAAGWEVLVVSAGSAWYIERLLGRAGVPAKVYSNRGWLEKGRGLVIEKLPRSSPFYSEDVGVDKCAVVRDALARSEAVAFAGDGPPDLAPALLVAEGRRFARGYLAGELDRCGEGYQGYSRWSAIAEALL